MVELPPPVLRPEDVATAKGGALAARELHFTGEVDRILNTITLPLVGRTPEQRSLDRQREAARLAHLDETAHMAAVLERSDPAGASELREHLHQVALHDNAFRDDLPPALRREAR